MEEEEEGGFQPPLMEGGKERLRPAGQHPALSPGKGRTGEEGEWGQGKGWLEAGWRLRLR